MAISELKDLISPALHFIGKEYTGIQAVQIGAMDGLNFDDTRGFFDMYQWKSILVEPIPEIFEEIKDEDIQNVVTTYNLQPYMQEEMQKILWVCKIKI